MPAPFAENGSYPLRTAAALDFFVDGEAAFAAIAQAIEGAQEYVYMTCCYASLNFRLCPPDEEQLLDLCRRIAARGVRVAILFWQAVRLLGQPDTGVGGTVPFTSYGEIERLAPGLLCRWDEAKGYGIYPARVSCHHQKTFVIDGRTAFVGGINMTQEYWDTAAHSFGDERRVSYDITDPARRSAMALAPGTLPLHDLFARIEGPAVADVEANFVERWNGATFKASPADLAVASAALPPASGTPIQILRTIAPHTYPHTAAGEQSIKEAMLNVLAAAQRSVYFENQYFFDADVVAALRAAAVRGVRVVGLLARQPDAGTFAGRVEHALEAPAVETMSWTLGDPHIREQVQLYSPYTEGPAPHKDIYVHAKDMVVDGRYVLLGSANISFTSLEFHSEMCLLADDPARAAALQRRLFAEHLCLPEQSVPADFTAAANLWQVHGAANAAALRAGKPLPSRPVPLGAGL